MSSAASTPIVFTTLAAGLRAAEGPLVLADRSVVCVEVMGGALARVTPEGAVSRIAVLGGGPNGAAIGPGGRCYVCNNGGVSDGDVGRLSQGLKAEGAPSAGSIQVVDLATGAFETLYEACGAIRLSAPNDIVFDADGGFYFTDHGNLREPGPLPGAVYYAQPDGSDIRLAVPDMERPNGVGLSPAGDVLYVAETSSGRLWRFPIKAPGVIDRQTGGVLFADPELRMDSLAVQADGRVCVACPSNNLILRAALDGTGERIPTPEGWPTNICFGGPDHRTAYVTSLVSGELWRADWDSPGLRLEFEPG